MKYDFKECTLWIFCCWQEGFAGWRWLRATAGWAPAICNGDSEQPGLEYGQAALLHHRGHAQLSCVGDFGQIISPGTSVGQQRPPWTSCSPHRQAMAMLKQTSKHRKVPPPSPQGAVPQHSAFRGVSRLNSAPIISHLLSGNKHGHTHLFGREESLAGNGACSTFTERYGGCLHGLGRVNGPKHHWQRKWFREHNLALLQMQKIRPSVRGTF